MRHSAPRFVACISGIPPRSARRRHFSKLRCLTVNFVALEMLVEIKGGYCGEMATNGAMGNNAAAITKQIVLAASQLETWIR